MSLDERYVVKPLRKALQLLDVLVSEGRPMNLSELAERTALPKTSAFRYLYTLAAGGLVRQVDAGSRYVVGPRLAAIPAPIAAIEALKDAALPEMQRLQYRFNETVNLAIADGPDLVYLAMVGSTRSLRMEAAPGSRDPLHSTGLGKAILAARPVAERFAGLPRELARRTPCTLADREALGANLDAAAERGYAFDLEENELGAHCVATVIPHSDPIAGLSISGPAQRLPESILPRMGCALRQAAETIAPKLASLRHC